VTMTLPTINTTARIVFLVTDTDKADTVAYAFADEITTEAPDNLTRKAPIPVEVFLNQAAAVRLEP